MATNGRRCAQPQNSSADKTNAKRKIKKENTFFTKFSLSFNFGKIDKVFPLSPFLLFNSALVRHSYWSFFHHVLLTIKHTFILSLGFISFSSVFLAVVFATHTNVKPKHINPKKIRMYKRILSVSMISAWWVYCSSHVMAVEVCFRIFIDVLWLFDVCFVAAFSPYINHNSSMITIKVQKRHWHLINLPLPVEFYTEHQFSCFYSFPKLQSIIACVQLNHRVLLFILSATLDNWKLKIEKYFP